MSNPPSTEFYWRDDEPHDPKNYYKLWYLSRKGVDHKLINLKYIKMFGEAIDGIIDPNEIHWEEKPKKYRYTGGYGNFHLMRFSRGFFIDVFPNWEFYKDAPADETALEYFKNQKNDRYGQDAGIFVKQRPYTLFPLQMAATKDFKLTLRYIKWATENKVYTIFKTHPCPGDETYYGPVWKYAEKLGIISEYTELADGYRSEEIIRDADRVVSVDSGCTFKAVMHDIPVCNLRGPVMMTDIVPLVKVDSGILDVKAVPMKDKVKWLNWFYNRVCIDFHRDDYKERLLEKYYKYHTHDISDYEVHKW